MTNKSNEASKEIINQKPPIEKPVSTTKKIDAKEFISKCAIGDDPIAIFEQAQQELDNPKSKPKSGEELTTKSSLYKALTLFEFDKGILMASAIPERYRAFSIDFSRNLQKEYQCGTPSEKATAELVVINFVRTLEIQCKITAYLSRDGVTDIGVRYLAVLSKELDKANRHYLSSLQTLKMIKQPAIEVNIKTQTAIVGQNQIVQSNNK